MSKWKGLVSWLRLGGAILAAKDAKIKGVPIGKIIEEAEKAAPVVIDGVNRVKATRPKAVPPRGSTGD